MDDAISVSRTELAKLNTALTECRCREGKLLRENERLKGELEIAVLDLAAVEDLPKRELIQETREYREAVTNLTAERDKYRDMADRRQQQFQQLKASFDEVVRQRDEYRRALDSACEDTDDAIRETLGFGVDTPGATIAKHYLAEARQAGEGEK